MKQEFEIVFRLDDVINTIASSNRMNVKDTFILKASIIKELDGLNYVNLQKILKNKGHNLDFSEIHKYQITKLYLEDKENEYRENNDTFNQIDFLKDLCSDIRYDKFQIIINQLVNNEYDKFIVNFFNIFSKEIMMYEEKILLGKTRIKKLERILGE